MQQRFFPMDEEVQEIPAPLVLNELERMYQTVRDIRSEGFYTTRISIN